jgi:sugar/nucleoside kinase (ribokinase family)
MKYDVYGIGNALVDYLALVDDDFLTKNGIQKGVMTLVDFPGTEKSLEDNPKGFEKCSGGSAANTIVGIEKIGGKACFSGKVANDPNGEFYRKDMEAVGVDFFSNPIDGITGSCVSFVTPDGQRSMLTHLGVSSDLTLSDISEEFIADSTYLYIEGYQWSTQIARGASLYAMELAQKRNMKIAFSYSDPFMAESFRDDFLRITKEYVDLLFCNEDEAMAITHETKPSAAIEILKSHADMVCVTTGSDGAIVTVDGKVTATPALKVEKVVDTTGAGDLYAAGVLRGLTTGFDLVCSSMIGSWMAAAVVSQIGARL